MTEELRLLIAILERCVALEELQVALLADIVAGPLINCCDLEDASVLPGQPAAKKIIDNDPHGKLS
jgi:hypothetical protein